ncbi:uncharacterized protein LOC142774795 isoform X2 [Rhipicephalus microplus]|uniref:uncharacterized protein LOC142774795 isoform X2 n=1 Tax=Rhipicephalus microplus TaxID=6941 RepID=UPI003F6CBD81
MASFKMHLALTIVFGSSSYAIKYPPNWKASKLRDFQEMLNTDEKIWLTMTTKDMRRLDCDYWTKISLNDTDYDFNHWYRKQPKGREWTKQGPQKKSEHLHATLRYCGRRPAMFIRHYEEKEGDCEQRTWNSKIGQNYECDKVFWALCGAWTYPVFKKSCIDPKGICVGLTSLC